MSKEQIFSEIREQLKVGDDDKVNVAKIKSLLKDIESEYNDVVDNVRVVSAESKKRKEKIRDELMPKISEYEDTIEELKKTSDKSDLETELTTLREYKKNTLKIQRDGFSKDIEIF
jgi:hypothetical protein